jgi:predicted AAA+ superfamily ATPase
MKTLRQACTPRATVFDNNRRDTVHDINDLVEGRIDPKEFFAENFATQGMRTLLTEAFKRLEGGAQAQGVFRLSQSMGGGKTHNLIALGLLAKHPDLREQAMSGFHTPNPSLGEVRVAAFTGRQTDASYGIWGEIARQLGKQDAFAQYYSPLSAPGPQAWINLLAGEPLVILLDELPPYFNYAQTHVIGTGTLADVTTAALANLMNAVADNKLQNVVLVLTDLAGAAYQQGQQKLNAVFQNVEALRQRNRSRRHTYRTCSDQFG